MNRRSTPSERGFTLLELLIAVAISAVLCSLAYPTFRGQIEKSRRIDAIVTLMQAQMAQERWRANASSYGTLGEIGIAGASRSGHYTLTLAAASSTGYAILATARGPQARDADCRNLRLGVDGAGLVYASGPDASVANSDALNRRCWSF